MSSMFIDPGLTVVKDGKALLSPKAIPIPPNMPALPPDNSQQAPLAQLNPNSVAPIQSPQPGLPNYSIPSDRYKEVEGQAPSRDDPRFQQHGLAKIGNVIASLGAGPFAPLVYNALKQVPYERATGDWQRRLEAIKPELGVEESQNRERGEDKRLASTQEQTRQWHEQEAKHQQAQEQYQIEIEQQTEIARKEQQSRLDEIVREDRERDKREEERLRKEKQPGREDKAVNLYAKRAGGQVLSPDEQAFLGGYEHDIKLNKTDPGVARMTVLGQTRGVPMLDTKNGNSPVELNWDQINSFSRTDPGRFTPAGTAVPAIRNEALIEDIRGSSEQVRAALTNLPDDLGTFDKAKIAFALRSNDPSGAINQLISSGAINNLSPQQQEYIIAVTNLVEQAQSLRKVLGGGQGEDVRKAIQAVIPGPTTPNKKYALRQLDYLIKTIDRLKKGIPNVPLGNSPDTPEPNKPKVQAPVTINHRRPVEGN